MKKEFTANTVEEAKKLAAAEFGVDISKLTVTVVEPPDGCKHGEVPQKHRAT